MKKFVTLFFIVMCFSLIAVNGKVVDQVTGKPISKVRIQTHKKIITTDIEGKFEIADFGTGNLKFVKIGYENLELLVTKNQSVTVELVPKKLVLNGIKITETRAEYRKSAATFTNINKLEIEEKNVGQDIPLMMNDIPNVFSYSESGSGVGYSYLKVRGFDQKRIGVMINGIPLNDPEDHQVYWVNMPDLAESVEDIQFQRGVGTSLYGVSTFGGSMNMETSNIDKDDEAQIFSNFGSYNTSKYGVKYLKNISDNYNVNLRFSKIDSDGYRDNSGTDLWSFFSSISRTGISSFTELNIYGGSEETHASWYASSESDLAENHHHNPVTYDNEIDKFSQPHFELHNKYSLSENSELVNSLFYIRGHGYYEQYKEGRNLWEFGLSDTDVGDEADLIRQKLVEKNQYGWVSQYNYSHAKNDLTVGTYISLFDSKHWGEIKDVIDAEDLGISYTSGQKYYEYTGDKKYFSVYANEKYDVTSNLNIMANLFYQKIGFDFAQNEAGNFAGTFLNSYSVDYDFFNPRAGINYNFSQKMNSYFNVSYAHREPTDSELYDIWDGPDDLGIAPLFATVDTLYNSDGTIKGIDWSDPFVKPEKLINYEFGFGYIDELWNLQTTLFLMNFQDEIIAYGGVNDDGNPIRGNADETVHRGIEVSSKVKLPKNLYLAGNISYNDNYFKKFTMKDWGGDIDLAGNKIAGFPEILGNLKLGYRTEKLSSYLQMQHIGKQYLDNTENDERIIEAFNVTNFNIIYRLNKLSFADIELSMKVNNIFDAEYETEGYYDAWYNEKYYFPAAGRNIMFGFRVKL